MKHLLLTTIAAVVLVGCGESQQSAPSPEAKPVEPVAEAAKPEPTGVKAPDISIHQAAYDGNIEAVKQHIAAGTDVNAKGSYKNGTPLGFAAFNGHKEIVELLIVKGADVNAKSDDNWTPLHNASSKGHKEIAELLIAESANVNAKSEDGDTPLSVAIVGGHNEIAELLIAKGADVNAKMMFGGTHLHIADTKKIVELLIAKGANVNAKDDDGDTPLDWTVDEDHKEIAALLRKHGGKTGEELSIHKAAEAGNIEAVKQHLAAGTDVDAKDMIGTTPLHLAAWEGHKEVVELLIAKGADVNGKDDVGKTPLDTAIGETAALLRKHGGKKGEEL